MVPFGTQKAPSKAVVLPYFITAGIAFLVLTILMLLSSSSFTGHYFHPHILAITHIATLGWGTMIIFGASHQLLPVVMEVHLFSEKLAKWCYGLLLPGIVLLVYAFWNFEPGLFMEGGALLILSATILYAINTYHTAHQNKKWNITADLIVTASWWLVATALLGTLLVFNFRYPFFPEDHLYYLKIHAHIGILGWFLMLIMGVGSKLLPLFLLSDHEPDNYVKVAYYCTNGALLGFLIMGFLFKTLQYWPAFALIVLIGVISYIIFVRRTYREAARKKTDKPMTVTLVAVGLMLLPFILLTVMALSSSTTDPQYISLSMAYGISVIGGFVTVIILGQTFKTLPFIVWMHRYRKLIGKVKIPLPKDLYRPIWVAYEFYFYIIGIALTLVGVIFHFDTFITVGCIGLVMSAVCYNINVYFILSYKITEEQKNVRQQEPGNRQGRSIRTAEA